MEKDAYTHEIWKRIKKDIEMRYGVRRSIVISITAPIVLNIVAYIVLYKFWGVDTANQQIVTFSIGTIVSEIALFALFLYFERFYDVPQQIFVDQQKQINDANPDDPFEFIVKDPYYSNPEFRTIGIDISNNSGYQITCSASVKTDAKPKPEKLFPNDRMNNNDNLVIPRKSTMPFNFALAQKGQPKARLSTSNEDSFWIIPGKHKITIIVGGVNTIGKDLEHSEDFFLIYEGDDKLELKKVYEKDEKSK